MSNSTDTYHRARSDLLNTLILWAETLRDDFQAAANTARSTKQIERQYYMDGKADAMVNVTNLLKQIRGGER